MRDSSPANNSDLRRYVGRSRLEGELSEKDVWRPGWGMWQALKKTPAFGETQTLACEKNQKKRGGGRGKGRLYGERGKNEGSVSPDIFLRKKDPRRD